MCLVVMLLFAVLCLMLLLLLFGDGVVALGAFDVLVVAVVGVRVVCC